MICMRMLSSVPELIQIYIIDPNIYYKKKLMFFEWVDLTQMTIISATVGKNPLEEKE